MTARVALVTGGNNLKGIGRGIVLALAERGFDVAVNYVDRENETDVVVEEVRALGRRALPVRADITDEAEVEAMFAAIEATFGHLDVLVNNAGRCVWELVPDISEAAFAAVAGTNVVGTAMCSRHAAALMIRKGTTGRIINIASGQAKKPAPSMALYCGSKAAIDQLTQTLALELAPHGITVNQVWPGLVDTDINAAKPEMKAAGIAPMLATIPVGRVATAADIGRAVVFLAEDDAGTTTSATIKIDGGSLTRCLL